MMNPLYVLHAEVFGCNYDILVNGIVVRCQRKNLPCNVEIFVNQFLINGPNLITLKMRPVDVAETLLDISGAHLELTRQDPGQEPVSLARIDVEEGSVTEEPNASARETFNILTPLSEAIWSDNDVIAVTNDDLIRRVFEYAQSFRTLFLNGDTDGIVNMCQLRSDYIDRRYGLEPGDRSAVLRNSVDGVFNDEKYWMLNTLTGSPGGITPVIHAAGKLVSFETLPSRYALVLFGHEDNKTAEYPAMFGVKDDVVQLQL